MFTKNFTKTAEPFADPLNIYFCTHCHYKSKPFAIFFFLAFQPESTNLATKKEIKINKYTMQAPFSQLKEYYNGEWHGKKDTALILRFDYSNKSVGVLLNM